MSFPRYEQYKDSGVPWLGDVPEHWDIKRLGYYFSERREKVSDKDYEPLSVTKNGIVPQLETAAKSDDGDNRKKVCLGDFVINSRSDRKGSGGLAWQNGSVSLINTVITPLKEVDSNFIESLLKSVNFQEEFYRYGQGIVADLWTTKYSEMRNITLAMPSLAEQKSIAMFLDRETAKIDALVAEQEKLIELLKEKRQAVISHAVTKGLNPNAPMKPSGIDWLGDIPAHWEIIAIKWLSAVQRGASPRPIEDPKYFDDDGEYGWVRIADVSSSNGVLYETTQRLSDLGSSLSVKIEPGQLFISIAGTVGKPCIAGIKACIHDGFVYFPLLQIPPMLLFRIFECGTCYGGLGKMGTQLNLNTDTIGSIRIALPPHDEIDDLLTFIERRTSDLDDLITEAQKAIDLLQERRTALISAAVTGKIDVRGLVSTDKTKEAA